MNGFAGGPSLPVVTALGSNGVAPTTLLVPRFHNADAAPKEIGIVLPGSAWMFVSTVGNVNVMVTWAFLSPCTCHAPAAALDGSTLVGTPLSTVPKLRLRSDVTVIAWPITWASIPTCPATP